MTKYLLGAAAAAAVVAIAPAIAQTGQPAQNVLIQRAPMAAKTHTRADVGNHVRAMFERLDTNRDGYVTKPEAQAAKAGRADRIAKRMERRGGAASDGKRSANRDAMFNRLDTNRDGNVSRSEFAARPTREGRRQVTFTDRNGEQRPAHARMMRMRMGGLGGAMFDMADANRDGRVTLQEATAAAYRHFDTADVNRDGQITREERMQMHQRMRAERRPG